MVRIHPDPPSCRERGAVAQLGERLLCKQEVVGSIPSSSTRIRYQNPGIRNQTSHRALGARSNDYRLRLHAAFNSGLGHEARVESCSVL